MIAYLVKRLALAALLVLAVATGSLVLARLAPGDYATESLGFDARPEAVAAARARYGLDRPFASQYADWLAARCASTSAARSPTTVRSAISSPSARGTRRCSR